jgi:D-alanine-D-alanine ligase
VSAGAIRSIAIVYDAAAVEDPAAAETGAAEAAAVASVAQVIDDIASVASALSCRVERVPLPPDPAGLLGAILAIRADVVVNLAESWAGQARFEPAVAWMLECLGRPYTGAPPRALALCLEKPSTRAVLASAGLPVPRGVLLPRSDDPIDREALGRGPWIVKPAAQDASHGIDSGSVVDAEEALRARVSELDRRGLGPALIEEYIDGRELNVSIVELDGAPPRVLPIAEIVFGTEFPRGVPRILTYAAKWNEQSAEYRGSRSVEARDLDAGLRAQVEKLALAAWRALGLRDYGRVDLRLDARGPFVVDVNPNPDLSRGAGLCLAAERAGIGYEELVVGILRGAARRATA